jgi:hypothetical protein
MCICLLALAAFIVLLALCHGTDAGTTYINGNWNIEQDTILANGTWWVNGSVWVEMGTLRLESAQLVVYAFYPYLSVSYGGNISANDSLIRGEAFGLYISLSHGGTFRNCTFSHLDHNWYSSGFYSGSGMLVLDGCTVEDGGTLMKLNSGLEMRGCRLERFDIRGLMWTYGTATASNASVLIEDTTFIGGGNESSAIYIGGPGWTDVPWNVTVRGCTFINCTYPLDVLDFIDIGNLTVEGNSAQECAMGAWIAYAGGSVELRGNTWTSGPAGTGLTIILGGNGQPLVRDETILGGARGLAVSGPVQTFRVRGLRVVGTDVGVECEQVHLIVSDSSVSSLTADFSTIGSGCIDLHNCTHSRRGSVQPLSNGEIRELVPLRIASIRWQDGTPIAWGTLNLLNETDLVLTSVDVNGLAPRDVDLTTWLVTHRLDVRPEVVRVQFIQWGVAFYGDPFPVNDTAEKELVIRDDFAPLLFVSGPTPDSMIGGCYMDVWGEVHEYGAGMGTVRVRIDTGSWMGVEVSDDDEWSSVLLDLPDGVHAIEVNATDRVGNSRLVRVANLTIDSTPPMVEIIEPGGWVNVAKVQIVGRTEAGASVTIDGTVLEVGPNGTFHMWVTLREGENDFFIEATDPVSNRNSFPWTIILDTRVPRIIVREPVNGDWTWSTSVIVQGSTDEEANVTVNGVQASIGGGDFFAIVDGEEGWFVISVVATDRANNSQTVIISINIDQTPPTIRVDVPADGFLTRSPRLLVSGEVSDRGPLTLKVQGVEVEMASRSWHAWVDLVEGWNVITALAEDASGNRASRTLRVLLDTIPPSANVTVAYGPDIVPQPNGAFLTGRSNITLMVVTDEGCDINISGAGEWELPAGGTSIVLELSPGTNDLIVRVTDRAGNPGRTFEYKVVRDATPPSIELTEPIDGQVTSASWLTVRGTTEPGATVRVNGRSVATRSDGSFTTRFPLDEGPNAISIAAMDGFGNEANTTVRVEREIPTGRTEGGVGPDVMLSAGLLVVVLAVLVVLWVRSRKRPSREGRGRPTDQADPVEAPGEQSGGTRVRVRRGR